MSTKRARNGKAARSTASRGPQGPDKGGASHTTTVTVAKDDGLSEFDRILDVAGLLVAFSQPNKNNSSSNSRKVNEPIETTAITTTTVPSESLRFPTSNKHPHHSILDEPLSTGYRAYGNGEDAMDIDLGQPEATTTSATPAVLPENDSGIAAVISPTNLTLPSQYNHLLPPSYATLLFPETTTTSETATLSQHPSASLSYAALGGGDDSSAIIPPLDLPDQNDAASHGDTERKGKKGQKASTVPARGRRRKSASTRTDIPQQKPPHSPRANLSKSGKSKQQQHQQGDSKATTAAAAVAISLPPASMKPQDPASANVLHPIQRKLLVVASDANGSSQRILCERLTNQIGLATEVCGEMLCDYFVRLGKPKLGYYFRKSCRNHKTCCIYIQYWFTDGILDLSMWLALITDPRRKVAGLARFAVVCYLAVIWDYVSNNAASDLNINDLIAQSCYTYRYNQIELESDEVQHLDEIGFNPAIPEHYQYTLPFGKRCMSIFQRKKVANRANLTRAAGDDDNNSDSSPLDQVVYEHIFCIVHKLREYQRMTRFNVNPNAESYWRMSTRSHQMVQTSAETLDAWLQSTSFKKQQGNEPTLFVFASFSEDTIEPFDLASHILHKRTREPFEGEDVRNSVAYKTNLTMADCLPSNFETYVSKHMKGGNSAAAADDSGEKRESKKEGVTAVTGKQGSTSEGSNPKKRKRTPSRATSQLDVSEREKVVQDDSLPMSKRTKAEESASVTTAKPTVGIPTTRSNGVYHCTFTQSCLISVEGGMETHSKHCVSMQQPYPTLHPSRSEVPEESPSDYLRRSMGDHYSTSSLYHSDDTEEYKSPGSPNESAASSATTEEGGGILGLDDIYSSISGNKKKKNGNGNNEERKKQQQQRQASSRGVTHGRPIAVGAVAIPEVRLQLLDLPSDSNKYRTLGRCHKEESDDCDSVCDESGYSTDDDTAGYSSCVSSDEECEEEDDKDADDVAFCVKVLSHINPCPLKPTLVKTKRRKRRSQRENEMDMDSEEVGITKRQTRSAGRAIKAQKEVDDNKMVVDEQDQLQSLFTMNDCEGACSSSCSDDSDSGDEEDGCLDDHQSKLVCPECRKEYTRAPRHGVCAGRGCGISCRNQKAKDKRLEKKMQIPLWQFNHKSPEVCAFICRLLQLENNQKELYSVMRYIFDYPGKIRNLAMELCYGCRVGPQYCGKCIFNGEVDRRHFFIGLMRSNNAGTKKVRIAWICSAECLRIVRPVSKGDRKRAPQRNYLKEADRKGNSAKSRDVFLIEDERLPASIRRFNAANIAYLEENT